MLDTGKNNDDQNGNNLTQVAARACVSKGTVSRVFNNSGLIPQETRTRVLSAAREIGFRPRVGVRKKQIALVTEPPWKTHMGGYVNTLTQYICYALSQADAAISMITEDNMSAPDDSWFDGIIGIAWEPQTINILKAIKNVPIVWFSDNYTDSFHSIYVNCISTGQIAGNYLFANGHKKIAVIHDTDYTGNGRLKGVQQAADERWMDPSQAVLSISNTTSMHIAVKQLINAGCTAVWVTGEDMKVLEVNWLLQELAGVRVPDEISLMGFENPGISEFQRPSLTTIACPLQEMAEKSVEIVLQEKHEELVKVELPVKLIERGSVKNILPIHNETSTENRTEKQ